MGQLRLTCFGTFGITLNDTPLTTFPTEKVRALLVYLAVERQAHQRSALAQLLWPGYTAESANTSLRQTLRRLRQLLGDDEETPGDTPWLLVTRQTVQFNPAAALSADVITFTELLAACTAHPHSHIAACQSCLPRLQQAVDLYRGDFLSGFTVADSDRFEEWRRITQEQFHLQTLDALTHLVSAAESAGDDEAALQSAQHQLALEPWLEDAHRCVMRVLARRGQRVAALAQYNRCRQVLTEELGVAPDAETTALAEQIQSGEFGKLIRRQGDTRQGDARQGDTRQEVIDEPDVSYLVSHGSAPPPHNLPAVLTPFIGRERELTEIGTRLQQPELRLLTLVGAGGMGKTRLALRVAKQILGIGYWVLDSSTPAGKENPISNNQYPDGIFFVPLAPLTAPSAIAGTIADALGLETQGAPQQALCHFLQKRRLLLILDNFEHLLAGTGLVATLLQEAPGVQILVTSRERLNLRGEQVYPVMGLDYGQTQSGTITAESAAVQFFVHCAQQSQVGFTLHAADRAAVEQICQLVQGMPLALEMAAAWTSLLPLPEVAQEIARSADFLSADWLDVPERQRSMRAVFAWSWQLLPENEQRLLRQLAIFAGSFTRPAAEQIAGAALRTLTSLLSKSLLQEAPASQETISQKNSGARRYELHPVVRQFAAEQLAAAQEEATVATRYSTFYLAWLAEREAPLLGRAVSETVAEIQRELEHLRQAWRWAIRYGQWAALLQSAYCLSEYLAIVGQSAESEQLFVWAAEEYTRQTATAETALAQPTDQAALGKLWGFVAIARTRQGKATAMEAAQHAITLGAASGALEAQILGHYVCGFTASRQSDFSAAQRAYDAMQQLFAQVHSQGSASLLLQDFQWRYYLGLFEYENRQGRLAEAQGYSAAGLQIAQTLGSLRGQINLRMNLIDLYLEGGAFAQARQEVAVVLPVVQGMRWRWGEAGASHISSFIACFFGDYHSALTTGQTALTIVQEIGEADLEMLITLHLAYLSTLLGDRQRAQTLLPLKTPAEQQNAPLHIRYTLLIMATLNHWRAGQLTTACAAATEAWTVANGFNNRCAQGFALIYRAHIQTDLAEWTAASEDYQAALQIFTTLNAPALSVEAQAGLAQLALRQGNATIAQQWVEAILPLLADQPYVITTPAFTHLICYQVLATNRDPRAATLLQQGHDLLQQTAATLDDDRRAHFRESFSSHRALVAAYAAWREQGDKVTSDKVTESASHPVTPSPPHPLTQPPLPVFLSPLVGRARALVEISNQLRLPGVRLLTLVGPGGMGKTRLAVEVGRETVTAFADGVVFVTLAAVNTPGAVAPAIATALGLPLQGGDPHAAILHALHPKQLLLILDNFEHLLNEETAIELVVAILAAAPGVQMLVTSRERLNLRDEQLYSVQALAFAANATLTEAAASAAVRLFVQAAQRSNVDFQLTAANCAAVLRICRLVQGMPLGLELAAANVGVLPLSHIADAIEQSADFLAVEWRDLPQRQRSMRAVFTWSWQLLNQQEQAVFRQLALFQGGFTHAAAQQIVGATLPLLTRLLHKSLVYTPDPTNADGRYQIHELLRQFAATELAGAQEEVATANRHSTYYLTFLAAQQQPIMHAAPRAGVQAIQGELDNIRQAWRWGAGHLPATLVEQCTLALREFYWLTGLTTEAIEMFTLAAQARRTHQSNQFDAPAVPDQPFDPVAEARLSSILIGLVAALQISVGCHEEALQGATEALQVADAAVNPAGAALGYMVQGQALRRLGQSEEALHLLTQSVTLARQARTSVPHPSLLLDIEKRAYSWLASIALSNDDYATVRAYGIYQLELCQEFHLRMGEVVALTCLIEVDKAFGNYAQARQQAEQALTTSQQTDFLWGQAICSEHLAEIVWIQGDYHQAQRYYEQALTLYRLMNRTLEEATITQMLGRLYLRLGDVARAHTQIDQAFDLLQSLDFPARETCWATSSRARLGYLTADLTQALVDAEQALKMARQLDGGASQADALVLLGLVREGLQQTNAAAAYREAVTIYVTLGHHHRAAEPRAGLARLALAAGALSSAMAEVEEILTILHSHPLAGFDEPFQVYLTCHTVLAANHDPRAATLITTAHERLVTYATQLPDPAVRRAFLEDVVIHRAVQEAFAGQERRDKVTELVEVTLSPLHPVTPSLLHDWGEMPAVDFFTGRAAELAQVTAWLAPVDQKPVARLISILGLGGMGKTTLAAAATKAVAPHFGVVIWRSLLNAPPLGEILGNWLQILARQHLTAPPTSLDEQLRLLLDYLRQERCLLVLDNVESIFGTEEAPGRAGSTRPGYEGYDQLFQRIGGSDHQSCLLLTSREQPYALLRLGRQAQEASGRIRVLGLTGLDQQAGQALLQSNGLHTSAQDAAQLIDNYSGNPLALQIVAATIADFFGGDVATFRQEEGALFDGMRVVLDQQFARLSSLERDILVWLAIEREEVTVAALRSNFVQPVTTREFLEALQALQNRSLLETHPNGLTLQNVIIEYTTAYLVEQVCEEILAFGFWILDTGAGESPATIQNRAPKAPAKSQNLFLNRFALLKAQAKEYVRESQIRLILRPLADRLVAQVGKAQLPLTLQRLLESLRQTAPGTPGYAAGNLLNLLLLLEVDLHEYDFSGLCLWQAHLRNANAAGLRLTDAQLRDPTFTDNFTTIQTMAFHPTGELLAAGGTDGAIYLWQTANWQRVGILHGHTSAVRTLAFAPPGTILNDQSLLVSGGADGQLRFWHLQNGQGQPGYTLKRSGYLRALAFSPDGAQLVSGSDDQTVCLWQVATGELRQQFTGHQGRIYGVAFCAPLSRGAHQGKRLVISSGEDTHVYLWDADSGEQIAVLAAHQHPIRALACLPATRGAAQRDEAAWLATADEAGVIYLWDLHTLRPQRHWQEDREIIRALSFNADGTLLASAGDNGLARIWEPTQGRLVQTIRAHRAVATATFSPQTPFLLATTGYDRTISLWNAANGQAQHFLHGYRNKVYVAQFQPPAGNLLATGHSDGVVRLWQFDEGKPRLQHQLTGHPSVFTLAFSPDGTRLASGSNDTTIRLWDSATGAHLRTLYGHTNDLYSVAFSPDGRLLVSTSADQTIRLWDTHSGSEVRRFATQGCTSWSAVFHPNGVWVATGDFDHQVRLWEVATGRLLETWSGHRWEIEKVAFSPDGAWLASGSHDGTIRLWSVQGGAAPGATQRILHGHTAPLWSVAFSSDGSQLASCGEDLTVRLWDLQGPADQDAPCRIFTGHTEEVFTAQFHPNGHLLTSASGDGSVCFWETQSGALRHQLRVPGPYADMKISGVTGISEAQKAALRALGAVEE